MFCTLPEVAQTNKLHFWIPEAKFVHKGHMLFTILIFKTVILVKYFTLFILEPLS